MRAALRLIPIFIALAGGAAWARPTGEVAGRVTVKERGLFGFSEKSDRSGVVIWLEGVPGAPSKTPPEHVVLRQRDKQFVPRLVVIPRGGSVSFPNDDKIFHNVFSLSQSGKFDLGLYKSGTSKTVVFDKPGTVDVYCNIHPEMAATIKVLDGPWFAVSAADGSFRIAEVPVGTWPIVAWMPRGEEVRGTVTVAAGGTAEVRLEVRERGGMPTHARKDGTPYGRYQ